MSDILIKNLSHKYEKEKVLDNINLTIQDGELFTLLGPSGCGKTTILRILGGFVQPTEGRLFVGDTEITNLPPEKRNMGIVFQNYALFPNMTVKDNILYGPKIQKKSKTEMKEKYEYYLELTGLKDYQDRKITELSGGQQQRVAVARAIIMEPKMLLLDEPMSNLDVALRVRMREEIRMLQKKIGITTLFITHDQQEALSISDRIGVMKKGELLQVGSPKEIYNRPNQDFVAEFVGEANKVEREFYQMIGAADDGSAYRYFRPEQLMLAPAGTGGIEAVVKSKKFMGLYYEYDVEAGGREYRVAEVNYGTGQTEWENGTAVAVRVKQTTEMSV